MSNPFSLSFGMEPQEYITRTQQISQVIDSFKDENPESHIYMLTGVRGAGKTVMLSSITSALGEEKDWVVINASPDMDILNNIAAHLYGRKQLSALFKNAKIDLSALGIGVSLQNADPVYDITTALEKLFAELNKKNYKVLVAIDEIVNNPNIRLFAGVFQILLREKMPIFLLMTGLYENINNLQNENSLTFLYRAPKIYIEPLNLFSIARSYKKIFDLSDAQAKEMARLTNGYAYAYQVLGYLYWNKINESGRSFELTDLIDKYDETLSEYVYEKIWFELPETEKQIASLLVKNGQMKIKDIKEVLGISDSQMSVYRDRLKRRGVVDTSVYGSLSLILPRFREIAGFWVEFDK